MSVCDLFFFFFFSLPGALDVCCMGPRGSSHPRLVLLIHPKCAAKFVWVSPVQLFEGTCAIWRDVGCSSRAVLIFYCIFFLYRGVGAALIGRSEGNVFFLWY